MNSFIKTQFKENWYFPLGIALIIEFILGLIYLYNHQFFFVVFFGLILMFIFFYYLFNNPFVWVLLMIMASVTDEWGQIPGGITVFHITWGLALFGSLIHVLYIHKSNLIFKTPINNFIFLYLSYAFISLLYSPNKESGILFIASTSALFVFYLIIINFTEKPQEYLSIIYTLLFGNIIVTLIIIYQIINFDPWQIAHVALSETGEKILRASGPFSDPNVAAAYLMIGVLYSVSLLIYLKPKIKISIILFITSIFSLVGIILTFSRTAWVSLAFGLIPIFHFYENRKVKIIIATSIISFLLVFILFTPLGTFIIERFDSIFDLMGDISIRNRLSMAISGFNMFIDNPLFGVGFRGFPLLYNYYIDPLAPQVLLYVKESHTLFITLLAELGIIGFIFVLIWFIRVFYDIFYLLKNENNPILFAIIIGSFANFVSFNVNCLFYGNLFPHFNFIWLIFGLVYSIYERKKIIPC